jgi:hypothetical protein
MALLLGAAACTWVEPDANGRNVRVVYDGTLEGACRALGTVTVSVKHEVAGIERNRLKVQDELESLARNEAATMGGDSVQALGEPSGGEQRYGVYRCDQ